MRKSLARLGAVVVATALVVGCASGKYPPSIGLYTDATWSGDIPGGSHEVQNLKYGEASAIQILGLIFTGDAGIDAASGKAKITKVHHVDYKTSSVLGLYTKFTTVVYGE